MKTKRTIFTRDARFKIAFAAPAPAADGAAPDTAPADTGTIATLSGYAIVWNVPSVDRGGYKVRMMPGSVQFTPKVDALYHHEYTGGPLGDTESGSLRILPADEVGQPVEIDLPDTTLGNDTLTLVRTGRMKGMSFCMVGDPTCNEVQENGDTILDVSDCLCEEVTITASPAFVTTSIEVAKEDATPAAASSEIKESSDYTKESNLQRLKLERLNLSMYDLG